jgi:hypothetical protein
MFWHFSVHINPGPIYQPKIRGFSFLMQFDSTNPFFSKQQVILSIAHYSAQYDSILNNAAFEK